MLHFLEEPDRLRSTSLWGFEQLKRFGEHYCEAMFAAISAVRAAPPEKAASAHKISKTQPPCQCSNCVAATSKNAAKKKPACDCANCSISHRFDARTDATIV